MKDFKRETKFSRGRGSRGDSPRGRFSRGGRSDRSEGGRPEMHEVTCDGCGVRCEVPFKPSRDKPVYCNVCFKKGDRNERSGRSEGGRSSGINLDEINEKLDKIMAALDIE